LENCLSYPAVQKALISLPETLDETYNRILTDLPRIYLHETTRLLEFLAFSKRPIRIKEAVDIVTVDPEQRPRFKKENRMPISLEIARYCASLIVVREVKDKEGDEMKATITKIELAHFSVQTYLVSIKMVKSELVKDLRVTGHAVIAEICLVYLLELNGPPTDELKDFPSSSRVRCEILASPHSSSQRGV
jgi:hypothetical protein